MPSHTTRGLPRRVARWSVLVGALTWTTSTAQNPWVTGRRQRDAGDEGIGKIRVDDGADAADTDDFAALNELVAGLGADATGGVDASAALEQAFEMWDGVMESPEMQALLSDPDALRAAILDNPFIKAVPGAAEQLEAVLGSDQLGDPAKFKEMMRTGMDTFKSVSKEVASELGTQLEDLIAHPEKLEATMADAMKALGLDGAASRGGDDGDDALAALLGGAGADASPEELLKNIPGMEDLMASPDFKKQMEQTQEWLATMMDAAAADPASAPPSRKAKKKRPKLDLDEVEIDAINGAF
mmetsp:Transcript_4837/g.19758  ORF Transcript_4837/g.19758 Transcript_4837/m.19758 type:complete len:299 (+) Transcript_4837:105-1001(+)